MRLILLERYVQCDIIAEGKGGSDKEDALMTYASAGKLEFTKSQLTSLSK